MFKRILVAVDELESGTGATRFAAGLSGAFDAAVEVFHPVEPRGITRNGRDHQLAQMIAAEAFRTKADLVVLGFERGLLGRTHHSGSVGQQLARLTGLPVMAPPTEIEVARQGSHRRHAATGRRASIRGFQHV